MENETQTSFAEPSAATRLAPRVVPKMLPGIAGIFLVSFAAWLLLSMKQISRIDGISLIVGLGTCFAMAFAYGALPYCRMSGRLRQRKIGARYFMSLAAPTFVAVICISVSREIPIWNDRAVGISVYQAPSRSAATIFSFTDGTVLAGKIGWGMSTEHRRDHSTSYNYCAILPVVPQGRPEGAPVLAWARISPALRSMTQQEIDSATTRAKSGSIAGFRIIGDQAHTCLDGADQARKEFHLKVAADAPLISWDPDPGATYRGAWRSFWIVDLITCGLVILSTAISDVLARKESTRPSR